MLSESSGRHDRWLKMVPLFASYKYVIVVQHVVHKIHSLFSRDIGCLVDMITIVRVSEWPFFLSYDLLSFVELAGDYKLIGLVQMEN